MTIYWEPWVFKSSIDTCFWKIMYFSHLLKRYWKWLFLFMCEYALDCSCTHGLVKKLILLTCVPYIAWLSTLYAHTMSVNQMLNFVWYFTKNLWINYLSLLSLSLMERTKLFLREMHEWLTTCVCQSTY